MQDRIESLILYSLISNEAYTRKVLPFLKEEYFSVKLERTIFCTVNSFILKYNNLPTKEAIIISLNNQSGIKEEEYKELCSYISTEMSDKIETKPDDKWLLDQTEVWCQERALYNAMMTSVQIIDDKKSKQDRNIIPKLVTEALAIGFNIDLGHDYMEGADKQFEFYHRIERKIPFDIQLLNEITGGGLPNKTLTVIVAGTGVGKSLMLCHSSAAWLAMGKNVLYVSLEMDRHSIVTRIDANLLNVRKKELRNIPKEVYDKRVANFRNKTDGKLIVEDFPTASIHVGHIKNLVNELKLKKNFIPDVIVIDYVNIMLSARIKQGVAVTSLYTYVKAIVEEVRGLAMELDIPIFTASQLNRSAQNDTDVDFEGISDSHGTSMTADIILALISTEELEKVNQIMIKQVKNRDNDAVKFKRFVVGIDRDYMRLYDVEQSAQKNIADSGQEEADDAPAFDKSKFGSQMKKRKDFSKIKIDDEMF
jgi:replicative DNA helicase